MTPEEMEQMRVLTLRAETWRKSALYWAAEIEKIHKSGGAHMCEGIGLEFRHRDECGLCIARKMRER